MSTAPESWFEVLGVDAEDVARVGYSLVDYARDHEGLNGEAGSGTAALERSIMLGTTLADAASLIVLVDALTAQQLFARAAKLLGDAGVPEAWTLGLASHGSWEPSSTLIERRLITPPNGGIAVLAALYLEQVLERDERHSTWQAAAAFRDSRGEGWNGAGVPSEMFADFAMHSRQGDFELASSVLEGIIRRSDEVIRAARDQSSWHWRRFVADVPLIDPELLALGFVSSRVDDSLVHRLKERSMSPARVAVLAGLRDDEDVPGNEIEPA